jgi:hypothetical protein
MGSFPNEETRSPKNDPETPESLPGLPAYISSRVVYIDEPPKKANGLLLYINFPPVYISEPPVRLPEAHTYINLDSCYIDAVPRSRFRTPGEDEGPSFYIDGPENYIEEPMLTWLEGSGYIRRAQNYIDEALWTRLEGLCYISGPRRYIETRPAVLFGQLGNPFCPSRTDRRSRVYEHRRR